MGKEDWEKMESSSIWLPKEQGEEISGKITKIDLEAPYGTAYTLFTDEGEEIRLPSHKVLLSRMSKCKEGEIVRIIFKGEEPPSVKGQHPTKIYEVFRKK